MNARRRPLVLILTLAAVLVGTTACLPLPSPLGSDEAAGAPTPAPTVDEFPTAGPGDDATSAPDAGALEDSFTERDDFFREQQLPLDGSPLVAVTPAQKEFIAQQRAYVESQGASWSAQDESITLALAADACETAILNGHLVDASTLEGHVASSPLFAAILPTDADAETLAAGERNLASVMVFGTSFLCPDDAPAWEAAYTEVYGG